MTAATSSADIPYREATSLMCASIAISESVFMSADVLSA